MEPVSTLRPSEQQGQPILPQVFETPIPLHIVAQIFSLTYSEKTILFDLNRSWAALKSDPNFYLIFYSRIQQHIFNKQCIHEAWGDPGIEPRLPFSWLLDFNPLEGAITLVPKRIVSANTDAYFRMENLKQWSENPLTGKPLKFSKESWDTVFHQDEPVDETHWVWIFRKAVGKEVGMNFEKQQNLASQLGGWPSYLIDLTFSIMGKYNKTGDRFFQCSSKEDKIGYSIRVPNFITLNHIGIDFRDTGLTFVKAENNLSSILIAKRTFGRDANDKAIEPKIATEYPEYENMSLKELKSALKQARLNTQNPSYQGPLDGETPFLMGLNEEMKVLTLRDILKKKSPELDYKIQEALKQVNIAAQNMNKYKTISSRNHLQLCQKQYQDLLFELEN